MDASSGTPPQCSPQHITHRHPQGRIHPSQSTPVLGTRPSSAHSCSRQTDENANKENDGVQLRRGTPARSSRNLRERLSTNLESSINYIQDIAFPLFFRKSGRRSRSSSGNRARSTSRDRPQADQRPNGFTKEDHSIEDEYIFVENIELYHLDGMLVGSTRELGRGHRFIPIQLKSPTWCDKCGDFIWGVVKQCLQCQYCRYTCHHKCRQQVTLDCANSGNLPEAYEQASITSSQETALNSPGERPEALICSPSTVWFFKRTPSKRRFQYQEIPVVKGRCEATIIEDDADSGYHTGNNTLQSTENIPKKSPGEYTLTREQLRKNIEAFNDNNHGLIMSLQTDTNTFQGFIRVHMNLIRPINMSLPARPPSIYEALGQEDEPNATQISSFYLPKDTTKVIHIGCDTTVHEVIRTLLTKFRITDNPRKFALYEKVGSPDDKNAHMRRLSDDETPLNLCLSWKSEGLETHRFILQENDTGEIIWDAFSIPELENFLIILNKEENEYVDQIKAKYQLMKFHMVKLLKDKTGKDYNKTAPPKAKDSDKTDQTTFAGDKREPIFV